MSQNPETSGDKIVELTSLIETAKILNSSLDSSFIINHIMLASMGKLAISRTAAVIRKDLSAVEGQERLTKIEKRLTISDSTVSELFSLDLEVPVEPIHLHHPLASKLSDAGVNWIFSLRTSHRLVGYLLVGKKLIGGSLVPSEIEFVLTLCNLAAAAIENASVFEQYKESNLQLQRSVQELQTLFELSKEFSQLIDEPRAIRTLEFAIMGQTGSRRFAICLIQDSKAHLAVNRIPGIEQIELKALCPLDQALRVQDMGKLLEQRPDDFDSEKVRYVLSLLENVDVEVLVPLHLQGGVAGLLALGERASHAGYSDSEINFLSSLCNLAGMAINNARLFQESLAKQRLEEELNLAHAIQEKLLPREMPEVSGCTVSAFHTPSKQVGGDYFDVIKINDTTICAAIADVSGKGFPAALLMANLQSAFRALIGTGMALDEIMEQLNDIVYENTDFDRFITMFAMAYNHMTRTIIYVNAGHNYPFLFKKEGGVQRLDCGGILLGVMPNTKYEMGHEQVSGGEMLYMFTDGVNEALNSEGSQFSDERLGEVLAQNSNRRADEVLEVVRQDIASFVKDAPQSDDITQLCLKFS